MSNSPLVDCTMKSPNHSGARTHSLDRITPHCVVGQFTAEGIGNCFLSSSREASCNYGIGTEGRVVLCVDESNRSWCSSSRSNDQRAVTIECASNTSSPYAMNSKVYNKLIDLCVDICKRNGKTKLIWFGDKEKTLNYTPAKNEMVITVHRWFANKACPGDWLYSRLGDLAKTVTQRLKGTSKTSSKSSKTSTPTAKATKTKSSSSFKVKITTSNLNVRKGAGTNYGISTVIHKDEVHTITKTQGNWGKLKSGAGWICLDYTERT